MGALAESFGLRQGIKYRGAIRDALEIVLKLDAGFQQGSADRALGRWYFKVPGLFGGDKKKSEAHLRKAQGYNPRSVITHLFLAETLLELNREPEARRELEAAVAAPEDAEWAPEDRSFEHRQRRYSQSQIATETRRHGDLFFGAPEQRPPRLRASVAIPIPRTREDYLA